MKVAWTRPALRHVEEIQDHIAQDSPRAANKVANSLIERTNSLLSDTAMAGRLGRARGTRELLFSDLPYIVVYRVSDRVEILAVIHASREWPEAFE